MAARSSDLSEVTTALMLEETIDGYLSGLTCHSPRVDPNDIEPIRSVMRNAKNRQWRHLAEEGVEDVRPTIPPGPKFWKLASKENEELQRLFDEHGLHQLIQTLHMWHKGSIRYVFIFITVIFSYTTMLNIFERPEGLKISSLFILAIIASSLLSRAMRSTELRILKVELSPETVCLLAEDEDQLVRLIAHNPKQKSIESKTQQLDAIGRLVRERYSISANECLYFLEVERTDASDFQQTLWVDGCKLGSNHLLYAKSPVVANSIAALLIHLEEHTGKLPHAYFKWKEGNPVANILRFLFFGEGDTAPLTHEVLRRAIADPNHRPIIHVS
jgi:hypothetical protein